MRYSVPFPHFLGRLEHMTKNWIIWINRILTGAMEFVSFEPVIEKWRSDSPSFASGRSFLP